MIVGLLMGGRLCYEAVAGIENGPNWGGVPPGCSIEIQMAEIIRFINKFVESEL